MSSRDVAPARQPFARRLSTLVEHREHGTVMRLHGRLLATDTSELRDGVLTVVAGRPDRLVLDLSRVMTADDLGLQILSGLADDAQHRDVALSVAVPSPRLRARLRHLGGSSLKVLALVPTMGELLTTASAPPTRGSSIPAPRTPEPPAARRGGSASGRGKSPLHAATGWAHEVDALFDVYGQALAAGDAGAASRLHHEPTHVVEAGAVVMVSTRTTIERSLAEICGTYQSLGLTRVRLHVEDVRPLVFGRCEVTVRWCHTGAEAQPEVHARYRYILRRSPDPGACARIATVTVVEAPGTVPAFEAEMVNSQSG